MNFTLQAHQLRNNFFPIHHINSLLSSFTVRVSRERYLSLVSLRRYARCRSVPECRISPLVPTPRALIPTPRALIPRATCPHPQNHVPLSPSMWCRLKISGDSSRRLEDAMWAEHHILFVFAPCELSLSAAQETVQAYPIMSIILRKVLMVERVAASPRSAEVLEEITRKHFASTMWAITFASDGIEALDQMNYTQFDLIVIWNTLPDISPVNFLRLIRKHGYSTPLVFYCDRSYYNNNTIDHARSLGFHGVLPKPFTSKEFCLTLSSAISSHLTVTASLPLLTPALPSPTNKAIAEIPKPKRQRCRSPSPISTASFWDPMLMEALQLFEA